MQVVRRRRRDGYRERERKRKKGKDVEGTVFLSVWPDSNAAAAVRVYRKQGANFVCTLTCVANAKMHDEF
jgi:hypothetical protein